MEQYNNYSTELVHVEGEPEMQLIPLQDYDKPILSSSAAFIEANTTECSLEEIKKDHVIPVWTKDNEPLISHSDFIETCTRIVADVYHGENILHPAIRLSHPIKGRIPSAKHKPANLLTDDERTLFYERSMFCIEIPSIQAEVGGNNLSLTIGGVKSHSEDKMYNKAGSDQHFRIFIGFKNRVCTNLCVWSDGYSGSFTVKNMDDLVIHIHSLIKRYNSGYHLHNLRTLADYSISETQFAQIIGRCRIYHHLPQNLRQGINPILLGDQQIGSVVKDYYRDKSFCRSTNGEINLWKLYNLFTGANKTSYIDSFIDRSVNAYKFVEDIKHGLDNPGSNWYLP